MKSLELQSLLVTEIIKESRFLEHRPYLGLSAAGDCDRILYHHYLAGSPGSVSEKLSCFLGYETHDILTRVLAGQIEYIPPEEIILYDGLVQGHTDGAIRYDGKVDLIEIKTVSDANWIPDYRSIPNRHFYQVQAYLHYLGYDYGHIIYYARDNGELRVIGVRRNEDFGQRIHSKYERLVKAVKDNVSPACSCGHCRR